MDSRAEEVGPRVHGGPQARPGRLCVFVLESVIVVLGDSKVSDQRDADHPGVPAVVEAVFLGLDETGDLRDILDLLGRVPPCAGVREHVKGRAGRLCVVAQHDELESRDITITGCTFREISLRVRGIFPGVKVLHNPVLDGYGPFFIKVRTNPVGELRDATVVGNRFVDGDGPAESIRHGVTFTGNTVFAENEPASFNELEMDAPATTEDAAENKVADE
jgi:hypothetical protein